MPLLVVSIGYLAGSIPFAFLAGRYFRGVDIRRIGSGNVGAANVLRSTSTPTAVAVMRLLTNNPRKFVGLQGYGLSVSESLPLEIVAGEFSRKYLKTKKDKLGHKLSSV